MAPSAGDARTRDVERLQPIARRDAVRLARAVLESNTVRAAEALLEADDAHLIARLTDLALALLSAESLDKAK